MEDYIKCEVSGGGGLHQGEVSGSGGLHQV